MTRRPNDMKMTTPFCILGPLFHFPFTAFPKFMGFLDSLFGGGDDDGQDDLVDDPSLNQLREGYVLDYEMRTWEVTRHAKYDYEGWPADEWTLENGDDLMFLEYEYDDGDVFLLSEPVEITEVTVDGEPFRAVVREQEPPGTVSYAGDEYVLAEEGPAMRTVDDRTNSLHYWVYKGEEEFVALERYGSSDWNVYAGREVEPFEFDNILPRTSA